MVKANNDRDNLPQVAEKISSPGSDAANMPVPVVSKAGQPGDGVDRTAAGGKNGGKRPVKVMGAPESGSQRESGKLPAPPPVNHSVQGAGEPPAPQPPAIHKVHRDL